MILADPTNHHYLTRLGEVLFSNNDWLLARKYFAQSLNIKQTLRALYGLRETTKVIATKKELKNDKLNDELNEFATTFLKKMYEGKNTLRIEE